MFPKYAIFGMGFIGRGFAQVLLQNGCEVLGFDTNTSPSFRQQVWTNILNGLSLATDANDARIFETKEDVIAAAGRFQWGDLSYESLKGLRNCKAVIVAVYEDTDIIRNVISQIRGSAKMVPIFLATSTILIRELAAGMTRSEYILGLHPSSPVTGPTGLEIIPWFEMDGASTSGTNRATLACAKELAGVMGKKFTIVPDLPGFVENRILIPMILPFFQTIERAIAQGMDWREFAKRVDTAFRGGTWMNEPLAKECVDAMISSAERIIDEDQQGSIYLVDMSEIDGIMEAMAGFPMGPFALREAISGGKAHGIKFLMGPGKIADYVGLDVLLHCLEELSLRELDRWHVPAFLKKLVAEGKLGVKTGEGIYPYDGNITVDVLPLSQDTVGAEVLPGVEEDTVKEEYAVVSWRGKNLPISRIAKLRQVIARLKGDMSLKAIVVWLPPLRGAEVAEFPAGMLEPSIVRSMIGEWHALICDMRECPVPILAIAENDLSGGGYELALGADKIWAKEGISVRLPEVSGIKKKKETPHTPLGILPGGGGTQNLPRRIGIARTLEFVLTGEPAKAEAPFVDYVFTASIGGKWKRISGKESRNFVARRWSSRPLHSLWQKYSMSMGWRCAMHTIRLSLGTMPTRKSRPHTEKLETCGVNGAERFRNRSTLPRAPSWMEQNCRSKMVCGWSSRQSVPRLRQTMHGRG